MSNINAGYAGYARRPNPWAAHFENAPMVLALTAVLVGMYLLTAVQSFSLAAPLSNSAVAERGMLALWPMLQNYTETTRVLTASFLHLDPGHLASNTVMLLFLGPPIERFFGRWVFLAQTLVLAVAWSACVLWMDPSALTVGFSGVIFGYIGLQGYVALRQGLSLVPTLVFMALNIIFTVITPGVSLWGHIGGGIAGAVLAAAYWAQDQFRSGLPAAMRTVAPIVTLAVVSIATIMVRISSVLPAGVQ